MKKIIVLHMLLIFFSGAASADNVTTWISSGKKNNASDMAVGADGKIWVVIGGSILQQDVDEFGDQRFIRFEGNKKPIVRDKASGKLVRRRLENGKMFVEEHDPDRLDSLVGMVSRIAIDPQGRPWAVTKTKELYQREGDAWNRLPIKLSDIAIGKNGEIWGLSDRGVRGVDGFSVVRYVGSDVEETGMSAHALAVDGAGEAWVISRKDTDRKSFNIFRYTPDGWEKVPRVDRPLLNITSDRDGVIWVQDYDRKFSKFSALYKWSGSDWEVGFRVDPQGPFAISAKGNPVSPGFYIPEGNVPVKKSKDRLLTPNLGIVHYAIDKDDVVWAIRDFKQLFNAGYQRQILKWNGQRFELGVTTKKVWESGDQYRPGDLPEHIAIDADGSPWILGSQGFAYRRVDDAWQSADERKMVSIRSDLDGNIWALMPSASHVKSQHKRYTRPTTGGAVFRWGGENFRMIGKELPLIYQFAIDRDRTPWVVHKDMTSKGRAGVLLISRLIDNEWVDVPLPKGFTIASPMLGGGVDGTIWLGGRLNAKSVLLKWTGSKWEKYSDWSLGEHVNSDSTGKIWSTYLGAFSIIDLNMEPVVNASLKVQSTVKQKSISVPKPAVVKAAKTTTPEKISAPETQPGSVVSKAKLVGCWKWLNGAYIIAEKNGVVRNGEIVGRWSQHTLGHRHYNIAWPSIFDTLKLSQDGKSFAGVNVFGFPISGTRLSGATDGLAGEWLWMNGVKAVISQDKSVSGAGLRGIWKEVDDGYTIEWPIVDLVEVSVDGRQLQGKNQFGPIAAILDEDCAGP